MYDLKLQTPCIYIPIYTHFQVWQWNLITYYIVDYLRSVIETVTGKFQKKTVFKIIQQEKWAYCHMLENKIPFTVTFMTNSKRISSLCVSVRQKASKLELSSKKLEDCIITIYMNRSGVGLCENTINIFIELNLDRHFYPLYNIFLFDSYSCFFSNVLNNIELYGCNKKNVYWSTLCAYLVNQLNMYKNVELMSQFEWNFINSRPYSGDFVNMYWLLVLFYW